MSFKQNGAISSVNGKPLKFVDQFVYFGSNISSTENDVNIHIDKTWTAIESLSTIWKSDLSCKIKLEFWIVAMSVLLYDCTIQTLTKCLKKKLKKIIQGCYVCLLNKPW